MADSATFDLDLEAAFDDDFDPLVGLDIDADDEVDFPIADAAAAPGDEQTHARPVPEHDARPAAERIEELFDEMPNRRKTMLSILAHCEQARPVREVADFIMELKKTDKSVYGPNEFTSLLQRAGAIARIGEDGEPYVDVELEPKTVVVDGVEYLEPQTPPPALWVTTADGAAYLAADDPVGRLQKVFSEDGDYLAIYRRILTLCSSVGGADAKAIANAVDGDPLLEAPRYYSSRFVEKLKGDDALVWHDKAWHATDVGLAALDQLAGVEDPESDRIAGTIEV